MTKDTDTEAAVAAARAWLTRVGSLPPVKTNSSLGQTWTAAERLAAADLEIWQGVDVAFRQPAVTAAFDLDIVIEGTRLQRPMATTARLAARGVLLQPTPQPLDLDVRSIIGLMTLRFFSVDSRLVASVPGGFSAIEFADRTGDTDVAALLSTGEHALVHEGLPNWFQPPATTRVLEIQDASGRRFAEIAMSHRPPRWYVALPPTTMSELRDSGGADGSSGDRSPLIPRTPESSLYAAVDATHLT